MNEHDQTEPEQLYSGNYPARDPAELVEDHAIWRNAPWLTVGVQPITKEALCGLFRPKTTPARPKLRKGKPTAFAGVWRGL